MAHQELSIFITKVHAVATAVSEDFAVGARTCTHPFTLTIAVEAICPYVHEIILINITLVEVGTYARASRYASIAEHRSYGDARIATEETVAYHRLVVAQKALASVACLDLALLPGVFDKFHHLAELVTGK